MGYTFLVTGFCFTDRSANFTTRPN